MKIAYLVSAGVVAAPTSGVVKKIESHMHEWTRMGHEVRLYALVPPGADPKVVQRLSPGLILEDAPLRLSHLPLDALRRKRTSDRLAQELREWNPDVIYHRFGTFFPSFLRLEEDFPTVIEVNTDDVMELKLLQPIYKRAYRLFSRKKALQDAAGVVFLTHELSQRSYFKDYVRQSLVLANGIDFASFPETPSPPQTHAPEFVFIASPGLTWHGLDQIIQLARAFPKWTFHVIGPEKPPGDVDLPAGIRFYGELSETEYRPILQKADFGIGSLASHRKKMSEACPLKVREYLAYGLPVILRDLDTDFPKEPWFILRLSENSNSMSDYAAEIQRFVENCQSKRVPRSEIAHLDSRYKEKLRLEFFTECASAVLREKRKST